MSHTPVRFSAVVRAVTMIATTALFTGVLVSTSPSVSQADEVPLLGAGVTGTVTNSEDQPLEGIRVTVTGENGGLSGTTNASGIYFLDGLPEGLYTVDFFDPVDDYFSVTREGVLLSTGQLATENAQLIAQANYTLSGRVTSDGNPVEGLTVNVEDMEMGGGSSSVTDADGRYSVTGLDGGFARVTTEFGTAYIPHFSDSIPLGPDGATYDFDVQAVPTGTGSISGVVRDRETGEPIAGATVSLRIESIAGWTPSTVSGIDGTYSFTGLSFATFLIDASRFDYENTGATEYSYATVAVLVSEAQPNRTRDIRLTAVPTGDAVLSGCVTEADGVTPIPDLSLTLGPASGNFGSQPWPSTMTDELGCYLLTELLVGEFRIGFYDFESRYRELGEEASFIVIPTSDAVVEKDLELERYPVGTGTIRGEVTDARTGLAIEGATIFVSSNEQLVPPQNVQTDSDGVWSVTGLPAGQYSYFVTDMQNRFELPVGSPPPVTLADGATAVVADTLRSVVAGTASLSGRVRDAVTHLPLEGALVSVARELQGYPIEPVVTDATGAYRFEGLPAGLYYVAAEAFGYQGINSGIEIDAGPEELNIPLRAQEGVQVGDGSIRGTVIDEFGDPVAGAFVNFSAPQVGGGDGFFWATTDADGYFELAGLALTEWTIDVNAYFIGGYGPGLETVELTSLDPDADVVITLTPAATIAGTLDLSNIPPGAIYALEVLALDPITGEIRGFGQIDSRNRFVIEGIAAGEYVVMVRPASAFADPQTFSVLPVFWDASQPTGALTIAAASVIEVQAGETRSRIDIEVTEGASISGRVFIGVPGGVTGLPVAKVVDVAAYRLESGQWLKVPLAQAYASSFNNGLYQMTGLAPGSYRLEFSDYFQGSRSLATTYNGGGTVFDEAPIITVEAGDYLTARDVIMLMRRPDAPAPTLVLDDLGNDISALEGQIEVPNEADEGGEVTVEVGEELAGEWVSVWANSSPTRLADWTQVSSSGTVTVALPDGLVGDHRIAVQDADSALFGWAPLTVVEGDDASEGAPGDGGSGTPPQVGDPGGSSGSPVTTVPRTGVAADLAPSTESAPGSSVSSDESGNDEGVQAKPEQLASATDNAGAQSIWLWLVVGGLVLAALITAGVVALRRRSV